MLQNGTPNLDSVVVVSAARKAIPAVIEETCLHCHSIEVSKLPRFKPHDRLLEAMNRANQQQLFQVANQEVLLIRQAELNYYLNLYTTFGTKAVWIGGFTYGIMNLNIIDYTSTLINMYLFFYYVLCALTIASSMHVTICAMLIQVYSQGLALHGPLGSMAKAAEGMRKELKEIMFAFFFMIFCFCASTVWLFYCVMTLFEALGSTIGFLMVMWLMGFYCERIYLRFYWDDKDIWGGGDNSTNGDDEAAMGDEQNPTDALDAAQDAAAAAAAARRNHQNNNNTNTLSRNKFQFPFGLSFGGGSRSGGAAGAGVGASGGQIHATEATQSTSHRGYFKYIFRTPQQV